MKTTIGFVSLGCPRNVVDFEEILGRLDPARYLIADDCAVCDVAIINTCGFIDDAKQESLDTIMKVIELKQAGDIKAIIVLGCLSQRYQDELARQLPEVDLLLGIESSQRFPAVIDEVLTGKGAHAFKELSVKTERDEVAPRQRFEAASFAYLKISEGCNHQCSFCVIPQIKGPHRSRAIETVLEQAQALIAERDVHELVLIGQDISTYGVDRYGKVMLPELLERLAALPALAGRWVRMLYLNPEGITEKLVRVVRDHPVICRYFDMPIEHADDAILKAMRRPLTRQMLCEKISLVRTQLPEAVVRTSVIVGFPGETDAAFEELLSFLQLVKFERLGAFVYSAEEGTDAAGFPDQVDEAIKQKRFDRLMAQQQHVSEVVLDAWMGRTLQVLIDEYDHAGKVAIGRSYADAPEVDGVVYIHNARPEDVGTFITAEVTDTYEYDLVGQKLE